MVQLSSVLLALSIYGFIWIVALSLAAGDGRGNGRNMIAVFHIFYTVLFHFYIERFPADANMYMTKSAAPTEAIHFGTNFVVHMFHYIHLFGLQSDLSKHIIGSGFGLIGILLLYNALTMFNKKSTGRLYDGCVLALCCTPSLHFFTSSVGKDSIFVVATGLVLLSVGTKRLIWLFLGLLIMLALRPIVFSIFLGAFFASYFIHFYVFKMSNFGKKNIVLFSVLGILSLGCFFWFGFEGLELIWKNLLGFIDSRGMIIGRGSASFVISQQPFGFLIPNALAPYLFFGELGVGSLIILLETVVLITCAWLGIRLRLVVANFDFIWAVLVGSIAISVVAVWCGLALVLYNDGLIARQRWMFLPLIVFVAVYSRSWINFVKNH